MTTVTTFLGEDVTDFLAIAGVAAYFSHTVGAIGLLRPLGNGRFVSAIVHDHSVEGFKRAVGALVDRGIQQDQ